jgi:SAM-dependent methyltransferase
VKLTVLLRGDRRSTTVAVQDPIAAARSIQTVDEARAHYRRWARSYDHDVFEHSQVIGTDTIADLLAAHLSDRTASVIDLGCGTGAAGRRLQSHGFQNIDGVDLSPEMLAVARSTGAYRSLEVTDLNTAFLLPHPAYAASICAGTFVDGHVGPSAVPLVTAFLMPDAIVGWVIAAPLWSAFEPVIASAGFETVHCSQQPVRRDGPIEATMLIARFAGSCAY